MSPKKCTRCSVMNSPTTKFCSKCGMALDIKAALEIEGKDSEITMDFTGVVIFSTIFPQIILLLLLIFEERKSEVVNKMRNYF